MYYDDHSPPHFHARYAGQAALFTIEPPGVLAGDLPPRAVGLVAEWCRIHRKALLEDWERARQGEPLVPIAPLD